ncbi:MAG: cytochrome P450, partial [Gemmatimonadales bacterium]
GSDIRVSLLRRHLMLIANRKNSDVVLSSVPGRGAYGAGKSKVAGMSFLAPRALTVAEGDAWERLRPFNEHVLASGETHPFAQKFLDDIRRQFAKPVCDIGELRAAMGRAMADIVLGASDDGKSNPSADIQVLFRVVQNPVRRKLFGFSYRGRRLRLYEQLMRRWTGSADSEQTLIARARVHATSVDVDEEALLEQVPHWMFTFTGSGTDLLARTLALITSRADVHRRVLDEIKNAGEPSTVETVGKLPFLNACLLETGRLFPPVTRTFHRSTSGDDKDDEIVHYFPLLQRDDALGPTVHDFLPERWLEPTLDEAARSSNLFLRGPRGCPGQDLILFVCRAASARLLGELHLSGRSRLLAHDPLPISFPESDARFTAPEETS